MFNQWEAMAPMPEAVLYPAVAATNQRIYVFGGQDAMQNPVRIIQVGNNALHSLCHCFHYKIIYQFGINKVSIYLSIYVSIYIYIYLSIY